MAGSIVRAIPLVIVLIALLGTVASDPGRAMHGTTERSLPRLAAGAASIDELLDRLLAALRAKDRGALEDLQVTEEEYRHVIVAGNVEPGEPPQVMGDEAFAYFWNLMKGKSFYHREGLLRDLGGRTLEAKDVQFEKGVKHYAGYTAYKRLNAAVIDEKGERLELQTGSIAEVDGRFKFISYIRD